jgi:hypothetical protein
MKAEEREVWLLNYTNDKIDLNLVNDEEKVKETVIINFI